MWSCYCGNLIVSALFETSLCKLLLFVCCIPSPRLRVEPGPTALDRAFVVQRCFSTLLLNFIAPAQNRFKCASIVEGYYLVLVDIALAWKSHEHLHFQVICLPSKDGASHYVPCPRTQQANLPACFLQSPINVERQAGKLQIPFFKVFWHNSTREMNLRSMDCEADALTTKPSRRS